MKEFETFKITETQNLKQPTIYFWLKTNGFSENYIKHLRTENKIILNNKPSNVREKLKLATP